MKKVSNWAGEMLARLNVLGMSMGSEAPMVRKTKAYLSIVTATAISRKHMREEIPVTESIATPVKKQVRFEENAKKLRLDREVDAKKHSVDDVVDAKKHSVDDVLYAKKRSVDNVVNAKKHLVDDVMNTNKHS